MEAVTADDRQALLAQYRQAHERLEGLVRGLRAIDHELEGLATERQQHRLLHDACGALDQLAEIGGAALFWGDSASAVASAEHLRGVRSRVEAFEKRIGEIEDRREAVLEEIDRQELETDRIGDDLLEAQDEAERRQQEWMIERELGSLPARALIMPWTRGGEEDQRFRRSLVVALLSSLLFALIVPQIPLPLRSEDEETARGARARGAPDDGEARAAAGSAARGAEARAREAGGAEGRRGAGRGEAQKEGPGKGSGDGSGEGPAKGPGKGILAFREKFSGFTETQSVARLGAQAKHRRCRRRGERARPARDDHHPGAGLERRDQPRCAEPRRGRRWRQRRRREAGRCPDRARDEHDRRRWRPLGQQRGLRRWASARPHGRRDPDRLRPLQGVALSPLQPRAAQ